MRDWRRGVGAALAVVVGTVVVAMATPFWGAKDTMPIGTDPAALKPGQFVWDADAAPDGPLVVVVSLTEQRAYVYRNGVQIGVTTISTGKPGFETPTGVFTVLEKDKDHHSKKYDNAPMPYSERLTWEGVALHAGGLPGYPSSHGCVHLPSEFARRLFDVSARGMVVVIAEDGEAPRDVVHPGLLTPVSADTGDPVEAPRLSATEAYRWQPSAKADGPVSLVVSGADERVRVYRGGVEIGRARVTIRDPKTPLGTHVFVSLGDGADGKPRWSAVGVPGHAGKDVAPLDADEVRRITLPPAFLADVRPLIVAGTALLVTDAPMSQESTGVSLQVVTDNPPPHAG